MKKKTQYWYVMYPDATCTIYSCDPWNDASFDGVESIGPFDSLVDCKKDVRYEMNRYIQHFNTKISRFKKALKSVNTKKVRTKLFLNSNL